MSLETCRRFIPTQRDPQQRNLTVQNFTIAAWDIKLDLDSRLNGPENMMDTVEEDARHTPVPSSRGRNNKRPKNVKQFQVYRCGPCKFHLEFLLNENCVWYLERPTKNGGPVYQRSWNFVLARGKQRFFVEDQPEFRIRRNQTEGRIEFSKTPNDVLFSMEWTGKGDIGGLAASPRQHIFFFKGTKYEWSDLSHMRGTDLICRSTKDDSTVAYFRSVMTPRFREGKLELAEGIAEDFEERLVATFCAYRLSSCAWGAGGFHTEPEFLHTGNGFPGGLFHYLGTGHSPSR